MLYVITVEVLHETTVVVVPVGIKGEKAPPPGEEEVRVEVGVGVEVERDLQNTRITENAVAEINLRS